MGKKEQLIEYCIQDIVDYISEDENVPYDEAMKMFYNSDTFSKVVDEETGLYLESSAYVYEIYKDESIHGKIIQVEI